MTEHIWSQAILVDDEDLKQTHASGGLRGRARFQIVSVGTKELAVVPTWHLVLQETDR